MEHRLGRRRRPLRLAAALGALFLVLFLICGLFGLDSRAAGLTWRVRALLSGSDGPTVTVTGARDESWSRGRVTIRLTGVDDAVGSGIASITYVLAGGTRTVGVDSVRVTLPAADGAHAIAFYATDNAGTAGATSMLTVHVDNTGPRIATKAAKGTRGKTLALAYRIDDGASPTAMAVTALVRSAGGEVVKRVSLGRQSTGVWLRFRWRPAVEGIYTYTVTARDLAGNRQRAADASKIVVAWPAWLTIGRSVQGRRITVARFGSGSHRLLVIGGVHPLETGRSVAQQFAAYLAAHPDAVPAGWRIDVIPCLNPDGLAHGSRGNANEVDLSRNFPSSSWRHTLQEGDPSRGCGLSGGSSAGSEPETKALIAYLRQGFAAVLSLHSDAGILDCHGPGASALGKRMAALCGLPVGRLSYESIVTGTLEQYVAGHCRTPAIMVELQTSELSPGLRQALLAACR